VSRFPSSPPPADLPVSDDQLGVRRVSGSGWADLLVRSWVRALAGQWCTVLGRGWSPMWSCRGCCWRNEHSVGLVCVTFARTCRRIVWVLCKTLRRHSRVWPEIFHCWLPGGITWVCVVSRSHIWSHCSMSLLVLFVARLCLRSQRHRVRLCG